MKRQLTPITTLLLLALCYAYVYIISTETLLANAVSTDSEFRYSFISISSLVLFPFIIGIYLSILNKQLKTAKRHYLLPLALWAIIACIQLIVNKIDTLYLIVFYPSLLLFSYLGIGVGCRLNSTLLSKKTYFYSLLLLPFLSLLIESQIERTTKQYKTSSTIIIQKSGNSVWSNLLEIPRLEDSIYQPSVLNQLGVPRPLYAETSVTNDTLWRIGHFSDELTLVESVPVYDSLKEMHFKIHLERSTLRSRPSDRLLLQSGFFVLMTSLIIFKHRINIKPLCALNAITI